MPQFVFLFLGLAVALFGWFLDHGEDFSWVRSVFARGYDSALGAYSRLLTDGSVTNEDRGFSGFVNVVFGNGQSVPVVRVEFLTSGSVQTSQGLQQIRSLRFGLQDGTTIARAVSADDIESLLRDRYLIRPLLGWAQFLMSFGLAATFLTGFIGILKQTPKGDPTSPQLPQ